MRPPRTLGLAITLGLAVLLTGALRATATEGYELVDTDSSFAIGCLPPCLCPVSFLGQVSGTFDLEFVETIGSYDHYNVVDGDFAVTNFVGTVTPMTAFGTYAIDVVAGLQEMELTVMYDGAVYEMVSGIVDTAPGFPDTISIWVGTSFECYSEFMQLGAVLSSIDEIAFVRGDCNDDGDLNVADGVSALEYLFVGGSPSCERACDVNSDELFDISDAVYELSYLFAFGPEPGQPFPDCGVLDDALTCDGFASCP